MGSDDIEAVIAEIYYKKSNGSYALDRFSIPAVVGSTYEYQYPGPYNDGITLLFKVEDYMPTSINSIKVSLSTVKGDSGIESVDWFAAVKPTYLLA